MKVFKWQEAYKAKIKTMSNLALLAEIASRNNSCFHNEHWGHDCAVVEMGKRLDTVTFEAITNSGTDENGNPITILQIEGDVLNIDASGQWDLKIKVMITRDHIQKSQEPEDVAYAASDEGAAERKRIYAAKHNIKWDHLDCAIIVNKPTCIGPDCDTYLGTVYVECPHSSYKKRS